MVGWFQPCLFAPTTLATYIYHVFLVVWCSVEVQGVGLAGDAQKKKHKKTCFFLVILAYFYGEQNPPVPSGPLTSLSISTHRVSYDVFFLLEVLVGFNACRILFKYKSRVGSAHTACGHSRL